jgi:hypothetical protein
LGTKTAGNPGVEGRKGAYVLRREIGDEVEFVVLTLFESMDAVRAFAGEDYERAVLLPGASELLLRGRRPTNVIPSQVRSATGQLSLWSNSLGQSSPRHRNHQSLRLPHRHPRSHREGSSQEGPPLIASRSHHVLLGSRGDPAAFFYLQLNRSRMLRKTDT